MNPIAQVKPLDVPSAIAQRRSIKSFKPDPITPELLKQLVELTVAAPSSFNLQDWRIILIQDEAQKAALSAASWNQQQIVQAPVTFVFAADAAGWKKDLNPIYNQALQNGTWNESTVNHFRTAIPQFHTALQDKNREYAIKDAMIAATHLVLAANRIRIRIKNLVDECHKQVANYLTSQYKIILLPTFETSEMVVKSKRKLHTKTARQMLTWGHYRFERHLKQVAAKRGVVVIDVNESYTSKTCTKCGHKHSKLGGAKTFKCPNCGHEHDRDWGGARNIMIRALRDGSFSLALSSQRVAIAFALFIQGCPA